MGGAAAGVMTFDMEPPKSPAEQFVPSRVPSTDGGLAPAMSQGGGQPSAGTMLERLVDRLFLRALQCVVVGVLFGIVFFPVRGRGSPIELATAGVLLALAMSALACRHELLELLRHHPAATLLFPLPALAAVTLDGGFDSVWTPLVAATVGVPATLGLPWLSLGCAVIAATGQAGAAWVNRADTSSDRLVETAVFSAVGTVAAGLGISLSVVTLVIFLQRRPRVLAQLREHDLLLGPSRESYDRTAAQHVLGPAPRTPLSSAELRVVTLLAEGCAPKVIATDLCVALSTVRSHLKAAKRKTHTRTLPELVGLFILQDGQL
jgi:DNA-binding NarL/FixJ family response regulator